MKNSFSVSSAVSLYHISETLKSIVHRFPKDSDIDNVPGNIMHERIGKKLDLFATSVLRLCASHDAAPHSLLLKRPSFRLLESL